MSERRYVSNKDESVRMFDSDFLEFFSHVHPATPVILYTPVMLWMLYISIWQRDLSGWEILGLFAAGLAAWTFAEYTLHRWAFHYHPKTSFGKRIHFLMHGVHHDYPNDGTRLVMPPGFSIPLAFVFYGILLLTVGAELAPPMFMGLVFGYVCYDEIHYATHHWSMKGPIWGWVKKNHMKHHYQDESKGYGVTSPVWDYVFGTYRMVNQPTDKKPVAVARPKSRRPTEKV